ncbi:DUF4232 domain-containing protein [Streptomyces sp. NPDC093568]|uniref:DUF4232 domain-containing protein n=1 Tax=Streptomyces sp. NPDC093568 TaxID=3366041 RepID=UPI00382C10D5
MRTFRHARLLAATGAALTALALTACQNGSGTRDEGAAQSGTPSASAQASTPTQDQASDQAGQSAGSGQSSGQSTGQSAQPGGSTPKDGGSGSTGQGAGDDGYPQDLAICNGSNTRTTAQPVPRPLNHMLLTVTNTGSKPCALLYYPVLRFDEMQWVPQAIEDTKPQAVPMLDPGASGYAGVRLSAADGSGTGGDTGRKLTVAFQGRTPDSSGGPSATPPLSAKGVYYDSALSVSYWQTDVETALN